MWGKLPTNNLLTRSGEELCEWWQIKLVAAPSSGILSSSIFVFDIESYLSNHIIYGIVFVLSAKKCLNGKSNGNDDYDYD